MSLVKYDLSDKNSCNDSDHVWHFLNAESCIIVVVLVFFFVVDALTFSFLTTKINISVEVSPEGFNWGS